ncbi:MAG TPA: secondary thiamine-phosphate synthase enzyme YjbQ [Bacteroidales bacterium]|nr:secondary thiamine-phosphate synthase enzyme YjbQ [Bacteroidales bacterium]
MIQQTEITLPRKGRGYHLITDVILDQLPELPEKGMLNILIKHTSAGITINENADPSVRQDFESFMNRLVPEDQPYYVHTIEGADDMPAHLKASLIGQTITIPITNHRLNLGTWQGIYYCEFRNHSNTRRLVLTVYS